MSKISVFGSFMIDNVATMDRFPEAGETVIGKTLGIYFGGKGANQCVSLARLGANTSMIGMVGNDQNGKDYVDLFKKENINVDNVYFTNDALTGIAQIQINKDSQNRIAVIPGANHLFLDQQFEDAKNDIKSSDYVVFQLEMDFTITAKIMEFCKENHVKIVLNPAPAVKLSDEVLSGVDYIIPNETELGIVAGLPTNNDEEIKEACISLYKRGVKHVIVTLGSRGALVYDEDGFRLISSYHVKAVDTVAAGDSFVGAFTYSLSNGKSINDAIMFANGMGALTVQVKGAIPSLHKLKEVEEFIASHEPLEIKPF